MNKDEQRELSYLQEQFLYRHINHIKPLPAQEINRMVELAWKQYQFDFACFGVAIGELELFMTLTFNGQLGSDGFEFEARDILRNLSIMSHRFTENIFVKKRIVKDVVAIILKERATADDQQMMGFYDKIEDFILEMKPVWFKNDKIENAEC